MIESSKIEFYKFLNRELTLSDFEEFVYSENSLEQELDNDFYLELIGFNFKDKNAREQLEDLIFDRFLTEAEFETWRLQRLLNKFIETEVDIDKKLDNFYSMYCSTYDRQGEFVNGYRFLGHLGLNYFHWMDEGYLKTNYGSRWKEELEKTYEDFEYYHSQLKPIATKILRALEIKEIEIKKFGEYLISDDLKFDLESDKIFKLKHKKSR